MVHEATGLGAERKQRVDIYLNYIGQFTAPEDSLMTEEERITAEKKAEKLRRKRESNRRYMKKLRERNRAIIEADRKLKQEQAEQTRLQRIEEAKRGVENDTSEMHSEDTAVTGDDPAEADRVDRNLPDHSIVCSA